MNKQISPKIISITAVILVAVFAFVFYILAWTEPSAVPPSANISSPINVGTTTQYKLGALGVGGVFQADSLTYTATSTYLAALGGRVGIGVLNPTQKLDVAGYIKGRTGLCIDDDCRTSWADVGGTAVTYKMTAKSYLQGGTYYSKTVSYTCAGDPANTSVSLKQMTDGTYTTTDNHGNNISVNSCTNSIGGNSASLTNHIIQISENYANPGSCGGDYTRALQLVPSCVPGTYYYGGYFGNDCHVISCFQNPPAGCDMLFLCNAIQVVGI
ncbi:MAG: hypothetical protein ABIG40_01145 [Parcubacteria group bacterium]